MKLSDLQVYYVGHNSQLVAVTALATYKYSTVAGQNADSHLAARNMHLLSGCSVICVHNCVHIYD